MNNVCTIVSDGIVQVSYSSLKHKVMNKKGLQNLRLHFCRSICFLLPTSKRTKLTSYNVLSRIPTAKKRVVYYIIQLWFLVIIKTGFMVVLKMAVIKRFLIQMVRKPLSLLYKISVAQFPFVNFIPNKN